MTDAATKLAQEIKARHDEAIDDAEGCPFCTKGQCSAIRAADMLLELHGDLRTARDFGWAAHDRRVASRNAARNATQEKP